jgi:hypothetical protein
MWMLQASAPRAAMRSTIGENRTFVFSARPDLLSGNGVKE